MSEVHTIHAWSGPRSLSTAMMYSFSRRPRCVPVDEPLYANYLRKFARAHRPYRALLLESSVKSNDEILTEINNLHKNTGGMAYAKHIAKQVTSDIDFEILANPNVKHIILIRDPLDMIVSWDQLGDVHKEPSNLDSTCYPQLVYIFSKIRELTGVAPVVIDTTMLENDAEPVLRESCAQLGIDFFPEQLQWEPGPKDFDGLWGSFWYKGVHKTTGFNTKDTAVYLGGERGRGITADQLAVYREALPFYDMLRRHAVCVDSVSGNSLIQRNISPSVSMPSIVDHGHVYVTQQQSPFSDIRNKDILISINGRLYPREQAKISVFDSSVQGGDAVWEGLRVYGGRVFKLEEHIGRLISSAQAMDFRATPSREEIRESVFRVLIANGMRDGVHMRMTLSRGLKVTSSMNPQFNLYGTTLMIVPEWKPVGGAATYDNEVGIRLITACNRRNGPGTVDSKIHHCNLINNILPKIQANNAKAADALMLDGEGFVSETNATNVFMVKDGVVLTPHGDYCLPGITRKTVIEMLQHANKSAERGNTESALLPPIIERRVSLAEFHSADEVFTSGTMGELSPVVDIDGRVIGSGKPGPVTSLIQAEFRKLTETEGVPIPFKN